MTSVLLISELLFVKKRSNVLLECSVVLVGSVTCCSRNLSLAILISCLDRVGLETCSLTLLSSQFMSPRLKSPPSQMWAVVGILDKHVSR
ncbi:hypothetical protein DPMN_128101 [Dreissena polymorpha]|uniref:Uncharacterized protein n=1 Tax=Dreissena polymorpha TaxID=45954 RepID=A0A9D4JVF5_DREPO|nr:hypothetical protein DPMN_128101 [Dreissena polymorpha]